MKTKLFTKTTLYTLVFIIPLFSQGQSLYYSDSFHGGVVGAGYSPDYNGGGTGTINLPFSGTVRQAYLIAGRHGSASNLTVTLNGNNITLSSSSQQTTFSSPNYGGSSGTHVVDVTSYVTSGNNSLVVPSVSGPSNRYADFYLLCAYDNSASSTVFVELFLNDDNCSDFNHTYNFSSSLNTTYDIGLALFSGYICDASNDAQRVKVNNTTISTPNNGGIGGTDVGSGSCGSTKASFLYENGALSGYNSNNPNQAMTGIDGLANINGIVSGTSFTARYWPQTNNNTTNAVWAVIVTYGPDAETLECTPADDLDDSQVGQTSATLSWSASPVVAETLQYKPSTSMTWNYFTNTTTSSSSATVSTGNKTLTVATGLQFTTGVNATVKNGINGFAGQVVSYSGSTLVVNATTLYGSGTFGSWNITCGLTSSITLTGLVSSTTYQWQILSPDHVCDSGVATFTTH